MKATIGLEIHLALATKEKLFSSTSNEIPQVSNSDNGPSKVVDFSLFDCATPGFLPVLNPEPVKMAIAFGLAVGAEVRTESFFERKHYFYPDLPLGYQITQQHKPILWGGTVEVDGKIVQIEHAHLECDAGKSIHKGDSTFIDIFRTSSPLLEIVSTPCMHSAKEAANYAREVHELAMVLGICDGKIEEGSFRVDASISISDTDKLGTRVEVKNISSFNFLEKAIEYEIERQHEVIESGGKVVMETRLFQESDMTTHSMRKKETVDEYRYLMDPDIPALIISEEAIKEVEKEYLVNFFKMKKEVANIVAPWKIKDLDWKSSHAMWTLFYKEPRLRNEKIAKIIHYWIPNGKMFTKEQLIALSTLGASECKDVIEKYDGKGDIKALFPAQASTDELLPVVKSVLENNPSQVESYHNGDAKIYQFLMGQCLKQLKGKTSVEVIRNLLDKELLRSCFKK